MARWIGIAALAIVGAGAAGVAAAGDDEGVREVGPLVLDGVPEVPEHIVEKMNQYQNVRTGAFRSWAPDGGVIIATRFGETGQLHHVASPGAARRQLTFYQEPISGGSFGRESVWLLFNRDAGGNEASQIFRFDLTTGQATLLTDGEQQNGGPLWSNDRDRFAWRSTARNTKDHDIWMMNPLHPEEKEMILEVEGYWVPLDWSPDDRGLILENYVSSTEAYFWTLDLETGEKQPLGRHEGPDGETISYGNAVFDRQGEGVFFTSDEGTEHKTLRYLPLGETDFEEITADIPWSIGGLVMTKDRRRLSFSVNESGTDRLYFMDTETREYRAVDLPLGILTGRDFSDDGKHFAFTFNTPSTPADVYSVEVESGEITRWTYSEVGGLDTGIFQTSELIHFPTFDEDESGDRRMIPAFVYKPKGSGPFPVILNIHGGPESQAKAYFSSLTQYQVNELGCAVIYPNVRGSNGFGKSYLLLDNGFKREDSVRDIGALLDWIETQDDLDSDRVGVIGGSYGGYMVLSSLMNYPDRIRAGIDLVGISNFVTFLKNTKDYRRDLRRAEYGDERDPAMYEHLMKISPTENVDKLASPLFVIQGANDPRVPQSEGEQIVKAVRDKGKHAWYMLAMDEGHGFRKKSNRDQMSYAVSMFWERYLLGDEPPMTTEKKEEVPGASQ
jgi:dipeptidyl aminopeptidase/acylaminoacyl peptidase